MVTFFFDKTRLSNSGRSFEVQMYHSYTSVSNTGQQVTNSYTRYPGQKLSDLFFFFALLWRERENKKDLLKCHVTSFRHPMLTFLCTTKQSITSLDILFHGPLPWASLPLNYWFHTWSLCMGIVVIIFFK